MKKRSVVFSPEARDDLLELFDWIYDNFGPKTAIAYIDRLEAHCLKLELASKRGRRRDEIREGLRIIGFERRVAIAFVVTDTEVRILRIFPGGRNWESELQ